MTKQKDTENLNIIRAVKSKTRRYTNYFGWSLNRDDGELGVVNHLVESLELDNKNYFTEIKSRGRHNDPPDCEAKDRSGNRIAIEVTELVDEETIKAYKAGIEYNWASWNKSKFISSIESLLSRKDPKYHKLIDPPYHGGYVLIIFTDEPGLNRNKIQQYLQNHTFNVTKNITRAYLLVSYDPSIKRCPYFELGLNNSDT